MRGRTGQFAPMAARCRSCTSNHWRTCAAGAVRGLLASYPLRHAFGMTPPPKGEARLGSPFGGAVAVRRLRGQPASASTQPMRGGRWQLALSVLANASPPPPKGEARLGFLQTSGCVPTWLPPWGPLRPGGTLPSGRSPLPRRSVMGAAHWAASPEPAGESAPAGGGEGFFSSLRRARALAS